MTSLSENRVAGFYDKLAREYDAMTGFPKRFAREEAHFRSLVRRYSINTALDAGCGTGFHALLLAKLGVDVTGVDISREMLARAAAHARELKVSVRWVESPFRAVGMKISPPVDAVFCLGNSLAHMTSETDLSDALTAFASVLRPGGTLFIQVLNYDRILSRRDRIQSVKEEGDSVFVRFYDFESDGLRFNILALRRTGQELKHTLESVRLRPVLHGELVGQLSRIGLKHISPFGNTKLEDFDPETSTDLLVVAVK